VQHPLNRTVAAGFGGVVKRFSSVDFSNQHTGRVIAQSPSDETVGTHEEVGPTALASAGVVGADPHVVVGGVGLHCWWNDHAPDIIVVLEFGLGSMAVMIGMKDELYALLFHLTVRLVIAKVVADLCAASHAANGERGQMVSRSVVRQVALAAVARASTEHLVVTVDDSAVVVDNIQAVVRFVAAREPVRCAEDPPQLQAARFIEHLFGGRGTFFRGRVTFGEFQLEL